MLPCNINGWRHVKGGLPPPFNRTLGQPTTSASKKYMVIMINFSFSNGCTYSSSTYLIYSLRGRRITQRSVISLCISTKHPINVGPCHILLHNHHRYHPLLIMPSAWFLLTIIGSGKGAPLSTLHPSHKTLHMTPPMTNSMHSNLHCLNDYEGYHLENTGHHQCPWLWGKTGCLIQTVF